MIRLPGWLRQDIPGPSSLRTKLTVTRSGLHTVCVRALCPNINDCFAQGRAAFMILGDRCTRNCKFCNINKNGDSPALNDFNRIRTVPANEPARIVEAVKLLGLRYVVITSVTRDDLSDGGASQFAAVIALLRGSDPCIRVEVLVPDFRGDKESAHKVILSRPFVLGHNLETVKRLYAAIRPEADYGRSLGLLKMVKERDENMLTKSSLMLGLGEEKNEVLLALRDLRGVGCDILTLGQYLPPTPGHYPVKEFIPPEQFREYADLAVSLGFKKVLSGPKVRSSYGAEELIGEMNYA